MRAPGAILLVACYELGHQPLAVAWPAAFLEREGYAPAVMDVSVEPFDAERGPARARWSRSRCRCTRRSAWAWPSPSACAAVNPACHIAFFGLYAALNAEHLLAGGADSVMSGEIGSGRWSTLVEPLETDDATAAAWTAARPARRSWRSCSFPVPSRAGLPSLKKYAHLERDGALELVGVRRGEPRLQAPVPALSDPARLRRAILRRAASRWCSPTSGSRSRPARPTSRSAIPTS